MNARVISAALAAACVLVAQASAQNLLTNGDFEAGPAYEPGAPNWDTFNFAFTDGDFFRSGAKAFKMYGPFFVGGGSGGQQSVPASPGEAFTLTGYAFSPATDFIQGTNFALMQLEFLNAANEVIGSSGQQVNNTLVPNTWTELTASGTAPAGTVAARALLVHVQLNTPVTGGAVWFDDVSLVAGLPQTPTWATDGIGSWFDGSNWAGGVPNGVGAVAQFHGAITAARTVVADQNVTLGTLSFDNANRYNLAGNGTLTLDVATGAAVINVAQGSHKINLPLVVQNDVNVSLAGGTSLVIADPLTLANESDINVSGSGTLEIISTVTTTPNAAVRVGGSAELIARTDLNGATVAVNSGNASFRSNQRLTELSIATTASASIDSADVTVVKTGALNVSSGGSLDINGNGVIVDYIDVSPLTVLYASIAQAYAGGDWSGNGITSSDAAANSAIGVGIAESVAGSFLGQSVDDTSVRIRATLKGDTNLDGTVDFPDLLSLAQGFNFPGGWSRGDSNYDNLIDFADLLALAQNFGSSVLADGSVAVDELMHNTFASEWARARAVIPEPTTLAVLGLAGVALLRRR